jgi:small neutral amino acid transporter SnatA (MarC family)
LLAIAIIAVVSMAGNLIFKVFGITLGSIRITGGIVVFVIGYNMLMGLIVSSIGVGMFLTGIGYTPGN